MRAAELDLFQVARHDDDFFLVDRSSLHDLSIRRCDETLAPELDAVVADVAAFFVADLLQADAVRRADVAAVRDGVGALDEFPAFVLSGAVEFFLAWVPADRCRVEQNLRALQRG